MADVPADLEDKIPEPLLTAARKFVRLGDVVQKWSDATEREISEDPWQRDTEFLEKLLPLMDVWANYFDAEVRGFERIPKDEPVLLVGNHSGGMLTPDTAAFIARWYQERGLDQPLIGLAFDAAFGIPGARDLMRKIGQIPASQQNAIAALRAGNSVMVYPGGSYEVFRPFKDRNRICFKQRSGFIKLALRAGVRVVPVVGHGGHETTVVLARGERLTKLFQLEGLRLDTWPILLQLPWGVSTPAFPSPPLPAKITLQVLEPMDFREHGAEGADDPEVVQQCFEQVEGAMQQTLSELADENPYPLLSRLRKLVQL